jgi:hypothetical protein
MACFVGAKTVTYREVHGYWNNSNSPNYCEIPQRIMRSVFEDPRSRVTRHSEKGFWELVAGELV